VRTLAKLIHSGIKLQEAVCCNISVEPSPPDIPRRELRHDLKANNLSPEQVKTRRTQLGDEIRSWRKQQARALSHMEDVHLRMDPAISSEDEVLFLPSDFSLQDRDSMGLNEAARIEVQLREGEANDAISSLCDSVLHKMVLLDAKNTNSRGVFQNTRALKYINATNERKNLSISRYREARHRLLFLTDFAKKTLDDYPELLDSHTYAKNAATARELGDGSSTDSWIWTFGRLKGLTEVQKAEFVIACKCGICVAENLLTGL